jgi:hypothetical protein
MQILVHGRYAFASSIASPLTPPLPHFGRVGIRDLQRRNIEFVEIRRSLRGRDV